MTPNNLEALVAPGPSTTHAEQLELYGRFVGSWELDWRGKGPDGEPLTARGEWHFAWVLDGRAVQDVWIAPTRAEHHETGRPYGEYGTTLRFYDPALDAWRIVWTAPVKAVVRTFVAHLVGDTIVQEETGVSGKLTKWVFSQITPVSFHWSSFVSEDRGETWEIEQEMDVYRKGRSRSV